MQLDPPAQEGNARRRLRGLLVWSGLTLLAAVALALAMVIASLALELGSGPPPNGAVSGRPGREWPASSRRRCRRRRHMHNQHAGLSQVLAEQRSTERH